MKGSLLTLTSIAGDRADLVTVATGARIRDTTVGASTLTVDIPDAFINAELGTITSAEADGRPWRFVAVKGLPEIDTVRLVFEDDLIARLREHRDRVMHRVALPIADIIAAFCAEADVPVTTDPVIGQVPVEGAGRSILDITDSWREISTLAHQHGGRAYSTGSEIIVTRDETLLTADAVRVRGASGPVVSKITFSADIAKPVERATFRVDERWTAPAGATVDVVGTGPANGRWLIETHSHDIPARARTGRVDLVRPRQLGL